MPTGKFAEQTQLHVFVDTNKSTQTKGVVGFAYRMIVVWQHAQYCSCRERRPRRSANSNLALLSFSTHTKSNVAIVGNGVPDGPQTLFWVLLQIFSTKVDFQARLAPKFFHNMVVDIC